MGPLGLITPYPGISYLFAGDETARDGDGSLLGIAYGGGAGSMYTGLGSPPFWNPSWAEMVNKIDSKFKVSSFPLEIGHGLSLNSENHNNAYQGTRLIRSERN